METTSTIPQAVSTYYDRKMLSRALPLLVHTKWSQMRDIPKNEGKVATFRKYGSLAAATSALTEGTTPSATALSYTSVTVTVAQYGAFVELTDFLQFTTLDPVLMETSALLGEQAGLTIDTLARDIYNAGTSVKYSDATSTQTNAARTDVAAGDVLEQRDVQNAILTLKLANAKKITEMTSGDNAYATSPIKAAYIGIVHPYISALFRNATNFPNFISVEKYAGQTAVMEGEIGAIDDVRFIETTNAKVFTAGGSGSIDVYSTLIFGRDAFGATRISGETMQNIIKPMGSAGTADPLNQRSTSGWKATFAAVILQQIFAVRIESARV